MTPKRFKEHFTTGPEGVVIIGLDGTARRMDGKPITESDRALIAGKDPLADQFAQLRASDKVMRRRTPPQR